MVANNVKTVYRLTNGANEDFIGNLTNNNNGKKKTTKSNNKEISTNSHLLHQCRSYVKNVFWKCVRWNRRKYFWSTKRWRRRKQLYIKQLHFTDFYSSISEVESSTDDVELFIELVRRFPVIWNPALLKTTRKRKTLETKLTLILVGAF